MEKAISTELQSFKTDLLLFLRESARNLETRAKQMSIDTQGDRYLALEKVNTALAYINLAVMVEHGAFDE